MLTMCNMHMYSMPPDRMIERGRHSDRFFDHVTDDDMNPCYRLKSMKKYMMDQHKKEKPNKKYFATTDLSELILSYPMPRKHMTASEKDEGKVTMRWMVQSH